MVTKVEAIKKVLEEFGGVATWEQIYDNIEKYYPTAKVSKEWKAGIRGVLYREIKNRRNFKKVGLGLYALKDYEEEEKPKPEEKKRMHSYIEGICLEIGNFEGFLTYTPDTSAGFKDNVFLNQITTLPEIPMFTYPDMINVVKRIDVLWFNKTGFRFPQNAFEVVDTIGTLTEALNRCVQLIYFSTNITIVGPNKYKIKFENKINMEPYIKFRDRFDYKDYKTLMDFYDLSVKMDEVRKGFFKGT
ncbi:MAG: hypothetical protein U9O96_01710 [Candidatus Thermoplasmatota archaeon]|nr:hypothetical protein [Candidatus Thermoplasmatota archaeon]